MWTEEQGYVTEICECINENAEGIREQLTLLVEKMEDIKLLLAEILDKKSRK